MSNSKDFFGSIPEAFYETYTYLAPSAFFFGGIALVITDKNVKEIGNYIWSSGDWSGLPFLIAVILGLLISGQILNSLCHYILGKGLWYIWRKELNELNTPWKRDMNFDEYEKVLRNAKNRFIGDSAAANMPKIAAKKIAALNIAFSGLCLMAFLLYHFYCMYDNEVKYALFFEVVFPMTIIALIDYRKRMGDEAKYIVSLLEKEKLKDNLFIDNHCSTELSIHPQ